MNEASNFKSKVTNWLRQFLTQFQAKDVTPYMHALYANNVGKDDLRRKLPPKQAQSSSRRDITLTTSDRLEKHVQRKVVDRSTPKYDCQSHYSGPSGEGSLMVPINLNSVDRYKYDNKSAASLGRSFHKTPRNRAPKRSLEGIEHGLIHTKVRKQLKYPPLNIIRHRQFNHVTHQRRQGLPRKGRKSTNMILRKKCVPCKRLHKTHKMRKRWYNPWVINVLRSCARKTIPKKPLPN